MKRVMVEVRFHIAPSKRTSPEMCIMKPLSFDVWRKTGEGVELLEIIDVEIGMFNDTPSPITLSIILLCQLGCPRTDRPLAWHEKVCCHAVCLPLANVGHGVADPRYKRLLG